MRGREAMTTEIACLGGTRKRPWTRVGAKGNGVSDYISVLAPAAGVVSGHADRTGKRGGKDVRSSRRGRSHQQPTCAVQLCHNLAQPLAMVGIRRPEAQVDDVHALGHRPAEGSFEDGNGGSEAVRKNFNSVEFDLRGLGPQDAS